MSDISDSDSEYDYSSSSEEEEDYEVSSPPPKRMREDNNHQHKNKRQKKSTYGYESDDGFIVSDDDLDWELDHARDEESETEDDDNNIEENKILKQRRRIRVQDTLQSMTGKRYSCGQCGQISKIARDLGFRRTGQYHIDTSEGQVRHMTCDLIHYDTGDRDLLLQASKIFDKRKKIPTPNKFMFNKIRRHLRKLNRDQTLSDGAIQTLHKKVQYFLFDKTGSFQKTCKYDKEMDMAVSAYFARYSHE